jgi:hypothetical protein
MPYTHIPQIGDRRNEKMAVFLTAENVAGLLCFAGPVYILSAGWPLLPRMIALIVAAVLGVGLTIPVAGMPLYVRLLWYVRGLLWQWRYGSDVRPEHLEGASRRHTRTVILPASGLARSGRRRRRQRVQAHVQGSPQHTRLHQHLLAALSEQSPTSTNDANPGTDKLSP